VDEIKTSQTVMLVNLAEPLEKRIAVIRGGRLQEFYTERRTTREAAGNIYKGAVESVEPSLDAAFVNIGGNRKGFLQANSAIPAVRKKRSLFPFPRRRKREIPAPAGRKIRELLKPGDELLVQITKEAIGEKGPALTMYISIPGRYLVITPKQPTRGISRKIEDPSQRQPLRDMIDQIKLPEGIGAIIRTAGEGRTLRELEKDADYLLKIWRSIEESCIKSPVGTLLYAETDLAIRAARDIFSPDIDEIMIDSEEAFSKTRDFFLAVMPRYSSRVRLYTGSAPLFEEYSIEEQIQEVYKRRLPLPGGGSIVIDETEALVAIDVNSGSSRKGDEKESSFKVNMEAAEEIARQLRLRDLGGLVVIDFIDMEDRERVRQLEHRVRTLLRRDRAKTDMSRISRFGTMEITRQRLRPSVQLLSSDRCPSCRGTGVVPSPETVSLKALRTIKSHLSRSPKRTILALLAPEVANYLQNNMRRDILALENKFSTQIVINPDPLIGIDEVKIGQL
jgi:ribonuclease E